MEVGLKKVPIISLHGEGRLVAVTYPISHEKVTYLFSCLVCSFIGQCTLLVNPLEQYSLRKLQT